MNQKPILSIETSSKNTSICISKEEKIIINQEFYINKSHSEKLLDILNNCLSIANILKKDLGLIAVSVGPGSYTGLRIGISCAKAISFGLGIPIIPISTLESLAFQVKNYNYENFDLIPMIDAGRMEIYTCKYTFDLKLKSKPQSLILDTQEKFYSFINSKSLIFGENSEKFIKFIKKQKIFHLKHIFPQAKYISKLAYYKLSQSDDDIISNADIYPLYIKSPNINNK